MVRGTAEDVGVVEWVREFREELFKGVV